MTKRILLLPLLPMLLLGVLGGLWIQSAPTVDQRADRLLHEQLARWRDPAMRADTRASLRGANPEFDLMWRLFTVVALSDRAASNPDEADGLLQVIDEILRDTLDAEAAFGHAHFLLPYASAKPWRGTGRSLFVDGEIARMLGARREVRDAPWVAALHRERVALLVEEFRAAPVGLPESYPDEAWMFCVTNALVGVRMAEELDDVDHRVVDAWLADAARWQGPGGMLGSEWTRDGRMLDGPEGSSIWLVTANLARLDPVFANQQYALAVDGLYDSLFGFAWAREWGPDWVGVTDVDSGPIVPILQASPSSSGFALLATRTFGDDERFGRLARSLRAADLLLVVDPRLAQMAQSPMGDAVLLHALTARPPVQSSAATKAW